MAGEEGHVRTPTVLWAQRPELVYITIEVPDVNKETANIKVTCEGSARVVFEGTSTSSGVNYAVALNLLNDIDADKTKIEIGARNVFLVVFKAERSQEGEGWGRLTMEKTGMRHVKVDWNKWKDDDDDEEDAMGGGGMGDFDLSQLGSLANFQNQTATSGGGFEEDSDDDEDEDDMPELVKPK